MSAIRPAIAITLALLMLAPLVPASIPLDDAQDARTPRGSILIASDDAFTAENGVRSGTGTADDPYVISGWAIVNTESYGIRLTGTRAHVLIEDVAFVSVNGAIALSRCATGPFDDCGRAAIDIRDAENIVVRQSEITYAGVGFFVRDVKHMLVTEIMFNVPFVAVDLQRAEDVTFEGIDIQGKRVDVPFVRSQPRGFLVKDVDHFTIRNAYVTGTSTNFQADGTRHLTVEDSHFGASEFARFGIEGDSHNITLRNNVFESQEVEYGRFSHDVRVIGNQFVGPDSELSKGYITYGYTHRVSRILICGNAFDSDHTLGVNIFVSNADDVSILANHFAPTRNGIGIYGSHNVLVAANDFETYGRAIYGGNDTLLRITGNAFSTGNGTWMSTAGGGPIDATGNWWGDASGPSGDGPGSGVRAYDPHGVVTFTPWLTERPVVGPGAVDCDNVAPWA